MRRSLLLCALLAALGAAAGCGGSEDEGEEAAPAATAPAAETLPAAPQAALTIVETEFRLDPNGVLLDQTGTYTIRVRNEGTVEHSLEVEGEGIEEATDLIPPGESADLTVDFAEAGRYVLYCPVDGHREQGMEATLAVEGAAQGAGGGGADQSDDQTPGY